MQLAITAEFKFLLEGVALLSVAAPAATLSSWFDVKKGDETVVMDWTLFYRTLLLLVTAVAVSVPFLHVQLTAQSVQSSRQKIPDRALQERPGLVGPATDAEGTVVEGVVRPATPEWAVFAIPYGRHGNEPDKSNIIAMAKPNGYGSFSMRIPESSPTFMLLGLSGERIALRGPFHAPGGLPAGTIELESGRSSRMHGILLNSQGEPLAGAVISPFGFAATNLPRIIQSRLATRTRSDGSFTLSHVPGTVQKIRITYQDYPHVLATLYEGRQVLRVPVTERISGGLYDSTGRPAPGGTVSIWGGTGELAWIVRTEADARGQFSLRVLPSDALKVEAEAPGFIAVRQTVDRGLLPDGLELILERGGSVEATVSGIPPDQPVLVRLLRGPPRRPVLLRQEQTDRNVSFEGLAPGEYFLEVCGPRFGAFRTDAFDLQPGASLSLGEIFPASGRRTVSGRVVDDQTGAGVAGARVRLLERSLSVPVNSRWAPETRSAEDGSFSFTQMYGSRMELEVFREGWGWSFTRVDPSAAAGVVAPLPRETWSVKGRVEAETSQTDILVALSFPRSSEAVHYTRPESAGSYQFSGLPPGHTDYQVWLVSTSEATSTRRLARIDRDTGAAELNLALAPPPFLVRGKVSVGSRGPANAEVRFVSRDPSMVIARRKNPQALTSDEGVFTATLRYPGEYDLQLSLPEYSYTVGPVDVTGPGTELSIRLPDTTLWGEVYDPHGLPLSGVSVGGFLGSPDGARFGPESFLAVTDEEGVFKVDGIAPGEYRLWSASSKAGRKDGVVVSVTGERIGPVEIRLPGKTPGH